MLSVVARHLDHAHMTPALRSAQLKHPDNFAINRHLAWVSQNPEEAIRFFTAALATRPCDAATAYHLAQQLGRRGKLDESVAVYRKAIALDPDRVSSYWGLIEALVLQGKRDEANTEIRAALAAKPNDATLNNTIAWILATSAGARFADPRPAVELASRAVELAPHEAVNWNTLGAARFRAGNWQGAIAAYEKSMKLRNGGTSFDWFFLAMDCWQLGERDKARLWYERAVQWMEKHEPKNDELLRFRAEAAELLGLSPGADRKGDHPPTDDASRAELVLPADPSAAQAQARLGESGSGPNRHFVPPADADMPNGPEAFAQP
jgi:tetratricopeptide (TPR) repeat protein